MVLFAPRALYVLRRDFVLFNNGEGRTTMVVKTRKQALQDFFTEYDLFMPLSIMAQEAIHAYVMNVRGNGQGILSPEDQLVLAKQRAVRLKDAHEQWKDKLVRHKRESGPLRILKVLYVLPKTESEIGKQMQDRNSGALQETEEGVRRGEKPRGQFLLRYWRCMIPAVPPQKAVDLYRQEQCFPAGFFLREK